MKIAPLAIALFAATTAVALSQPSVSHSDLHFLQSALQGGRAEVALARDVLEKTHNRDAATFAHRMINDHTQNDAQLVALDHRLGVTPASGLPDDARDEMSKLNSLSGRDLASEYLSYETQDHRKDISDFREEQRDTRNPQIRQYVDASLPVLRQHLELAQSLSGQQEH